LSFDSRGPRSEPIGGGLFRRDRCLLGLFVWEFSFAGMWPAIASTGLDFAVIDMEHSAFSYRDVGTLLAGARGTSLPALVRVPELNKNAIGRVLDLGADGVIVPHVSSGEEAADLVRYAKFAALGTRNVAFGCPQDGYGSTKLSLAEFAAAANAGTSCVAMIENQAGVAAVSEICRTPGIDAIWMGFADLSHSLGALGNYDTATFRNAEQRVLSACGEIGAPVGVVAASVEQAQLQIERGYRAIAIGTDLSILQQGIADRVSRLRDGRPS
jgi:2-keto-3-deoxy-L-rhamnonate aldolase RhmA